MTEEEGRLQLSLTKLQPVYSCVLSSGSDGHTKTLAYVSTSPATRWVASVLCQSLKLSGFIGKYAGSAKRHPQSHNIRLYRKSDILLSIWDGGHHACLLSETYSETLFRKSLVTVVEDKINHLQYD